MQRFLATSTGLVILTIVSTPIALEAQEQKASDGSTPSVEETTASEDTDPSAALRSNLEETIRVGEPLLRGLPAERMRIIRARLANLKRHLKRKEKERQDLQESLACLRADFYRRSAALKRNEGKLPAKTLDDRKNTLREDYELHAESFETELEALDTDVEEIREKIRQLDVETLVAESLSPAANIESPSPTSEVSERALKLPQKLNPFAVQSLVPEVRGSDHAPGGVLWALQGEIAFHLERLSEAEHYWSAALEAQATEDDRKREALLTNLAHVAYRRGDFVRSYQIFTEAVGEREIESLTPAQAYTLAVLSYLNGLVKDARIYLTHTDDEGRRRMQSVLAPTEDSPEA